MAGAKETAVSPARVRAYIKGKARVCPLKGCKGAVDGTGATHEEDGCEIAVQKQCQKCGATWDEFYQLADISKVTTEGAQ